MPLIISSIVGMVLAVIVAFIITGLCIYILSQMAAANANLNLLSTFANQLSSWGVTWYPIILMVVAAAILVGLIIHGFSK